MVFLGVEPRSVGVALADGHGALGGGDHFGWRPPWRGSGPCPFSHYALAFASQLRKRTENLSQGSRAARVLLVAPTWLSFEGLPRLACWTSDHPGFPGDFSQPSVGTCAFRVAVLRGSPHQLTLSRNSWSMLWCGRRASSSHNMNIFLMHMYLYKYSFRLFCCILFNYKFQNFHVELLPRTNGNGC
jgi:hypothetical protein